MSSASYGAACGQVKTHNDTHGHNRDLLAEYHAALRGMSIDDLGALVACKIPFPAILTALPAPVRIALDGELYHPEEDGQPAWVLPVRCVEPRWPEHVETGDPEAILRFGPVVDLVAFHPEAPGEWALRRGLATVLGAVLSQWCKSAPVSIHVDVADWLRACCRGLVLLTADRHEAAGVLRRLTQVVPRDSDHAGELRALLALPTRHRTVVLLPGGDCDEGEWGWRTSVGRAAAEAAADRPEPDEYYDW